VRVSLAAYRYPATGTSATCGNLFGTSLALVAVLGAEYELLPSGSRCLWGISSLVAASGRHQLLPGTGGSRQTACVHEQVLSRTRWPPIKTPPSRVLSIPPGFDTWTRSVRWFLSDQGLPTGPVKLWVPAGYPTWHTSRWGKHMLSRPFLALSGSVASGGP